MSVSYEKLPEVKGSDGERRSQWKPVSQLVIGVLLFVGALIAVSSVLLVVLRHHCDILPGTAGDVTNTDSSSATDLDLLVHALPQNGSCLCGRQEDSGTVVMEQGGAGSICYRFLGEVVQKNAGSWLKVTSLYTAQVSWKRSVDLRVAPESSCSGVRYTFAPGIVPQPCLKCICMLESGCKPIGCRFDVTAYACGYFQIHYGYWLDCGKPGKDWKTCANDLTCSSQCVQNFMKGYAAYYKCPLTCEGFAREHNGGPNGCHNPNTIPYWNKLHNLPGCHNMA